MNRHCKKCNYINPNATGVDPENCLDCGATYPPNSATENEAGPGLASYVLRLRQDTLYPAFRRLTEVSYWLWCIVAGLALIAGLVGAVGGRGGIGALLLGALVAVVIYFLGKVAREMSLMLADMSDAAVRTAAQLERRP